MPAQNLTTSPGQGAHASPRAYGRASLLALLIIAALIIVAQGLTTNHLRDLESDSRTINLAGRQRMLYLTISRACLVLEHPGSDLALQQARQQLGEALEAWQRVHRGLERGDAELGVRGENSPRARALLQSIEPDYLAGAQSARRALEDTAAGHPGPGEESHYQRVMARGEAYLRKMDKLTQLYEQESKRRVESLQRLEWLLTLAILLGLALVGIFIFRPMARRLRRDLIELEGAARSFEQLSLTDGLTGLANRRALDRALNDEWRRAWRLGQPLALLMLDIDCFKSYNDHYGHQKGDQVLRAVAGVLLGLAQRPGDLAARYGGEEMALLLVGADEAPARQLAEEARRRVESLGIEHSQSPVCPSLTVSVGVAVTRPRPGSRPLELVNAADQALYRAKNLGRNRVQEHSLELECQPVLPAASPGVGRAA